MNNRIEELAAQCEGRTICECGEVGFNYEKFAELIVGECCNIMAEHAHRPAGVVKRNVKEHFGVDQ